MSSGRENSSSKAPHLDPSGPAIVVEAKDEVILAAVLGHLAHEFKCVESMRTFTSNPNASSHTSSSTASFAVLVVNSEENARLLEQASKSLPGVSFSRYQRPRAESLGALPSAHLPSSRPDLQSASLMDIKSSQSATANMRGGVSGEVKRSVYANYHASARPEGPLFEMSETDASEMFELVVGPVLKASQVTKEGRDSLRGDPELARDLHTLSQRSSLPKPNSMVWNDVQEAQSGLSVNQLLKRVVVKLSGALRTYWDESEGLPASEGETASLQKEYLPTVGFKRATSAKKRPALQPSTFDPIGEIPVQTTTFSQASSSRAHIGSISSPSTNSNGKNVQTDRNGNSSTPASSAQAKPTMPSQRPPMPPTSTFSDSHSSDGSSSPATGRSRSSSAAPKLTSPSRDPNNTIGASVASKSVSNDSAVSAKRPSRPVPRPDTPPVPTVLQSVPTSLLKKDPEHSMSEDNMVNRPSKPFRKTGGRNLQNPSGSSSSPSITAPTSSDDSSRSNPLQPSDSVLPTDDSPLASAIPSRVAVPPISLHSSSGARPHSPKSPTHVRQNAGVKHGLATKVIRSGSEPQSLPNPPIFFQDDSPVRQRHYLDQYDPEYDSYEQGYDPFVSPRSYTQQQTNQASSDEDTTLYGDSTSPSSSSPIRHRSPAHVRDFSHPSATPPNADFWSHHFSSDSARDLNADGSVVVATASDLDEEAVISVQVPSLYCKRAFKVVQEQFRQLWSANDWSRASTSFRNLDYAFQVAYNGKMISGKHEAIAWVWATFVVVFERYARFVTNATGGGQPIPLAEPTFYTLCDLTHRNVAMHVDVAQLLTLREQQHNLATVVHVPSAHASDTEEAIRYIEATIIQKIRDSHAIRTIKELEVQNALIIKVVSLNINLFTATQDFRVLSACYKYDGLVKYEVVMNGIIMIEDVSKATDPKCVIL